MEKVINKISSKSSTSDLKYWFSKAPQERLDAIEVLRQNYFALLKAKNKDAEYRLQRVIKLYK